MFEIAVIGPFLDDRLGVVRQCIDCRAAAGPDASACTGFGPGCLVPRRPAGDVSATRSRVDAGGRGPAA